MMATGSGEAGDVFSGVWVARIRFHMHKVSFFDTLRYRFPGFPRCLQKGGRCKHVGIAGDSSILSHFLTQLSQLGGASRPTVASRDAPPTPRRRKTPGLVGLG